MDSEYWEFTEKGMSLRRSWPMVLTGKLYMPRDLCFLADSLESLATGEVSAGGPMLRELEREGYIRFVPHKEVQADAVEEAGNIISKEKENGKN